MAWPIKDVVVTVFVFLVWLPVCMFRLDKVLVGSNLSLTLQVRYFDRLTLLFIHFW